MITSSARVEVRACDVSCAVCSPCHMLAHLQPCDDSNQPPSLSHIQDLCTHHTHDAVSLTRRERRQHTTPVACDQSQNHLSNKQSGKGKPHSISFTSTTVVSFEIWREGDLMEQTSSSDFKTWRIVNRRHS